MDPQQPEGPVAAGPGRSGVPIWLVLAAVFGTLAALAVAVTAWRFYATSMETATSLLHAIVGREIRAIESELGEGLSPALQQVSFLAGRLADGAIGEGDDQRLGDLLTGSLASAPQLEAANFIRDDLHVVAAAREIDGRPFQGIRANALYDATTRLVLNMARGMDAPGWGMPVFVPALGKPLMAALAPVRRDGRFIGAFTAVVSLPEISRRLSDRDQRRNAVTFVLTADGDVLAHEAMAGDALHLSTEHPLPGYDEVGDPVLAAFGATLSFPATSGGKGSETEAGMPFRQQLVEVGGVRHLILYEVTDGIAGRPLVIGAHVPMSVVEVVFAALYGTLQGAVLVIVAAIVLALVLGRLIGRPVRALAHATRQLAALDFANAPVLDRSRFAEIDIAATAYNSMRAGLGWFSTYVPRSLVSQLMRPDSAAALAPRAVEVTVLFTDIVGFSAIAQRLPPDRLASFLNRHFALVGAGIDAEGGSIDKYIGDSIMAFWGAPDAQPDHAERAAHAALAIASRLDADNRRRARKGLSPVRIRIGIHSGMAIAGNIGAPGRINYTLVGDTVNIAQRLEQFGKRVDDGTGAAVICISADAARLLPPGMPLAGLGTETLSGRSDGTEIFRLG